MAEGAGGGFPPAGRIFAPLRPAARHPYAGGVAGDARPPAGIPGKRSAGCHARFQRYVGGVRGGEGVRRFPVRHRRRRYL